MRLTPAVLSWARGRPVAAVLVATACVVAVGLLGAAAFRGGSGRTGIPGDGEPGAGPLSQGLPTLGATDWSSDVTGHGDSADASAASAGGVAGSADVSVAAGVSRGAGQGVSASARIEQRTVLMQTSGTRGDAEFTLEHDGLALAWQDVVVRAPDAGFIADIGVKEGARAGRGTLLGRMDDRLQRVAAQHARITADSDLEVQSANMTLLLDEVQVGKLQEVFDRGAGSEWELREARFERDISVLRLDLSRQERELAKLNAEAEEHRLEQLWMRAPFDCYVDRVAVEPGEYVERGDELIRIVSLDTLRAEIMLPARLYASIEVGRVYDLRAGTPVNGMVRATLRHASRVIDPASGTFRCAFEIDNAGWTLPSGFTVWFVEHNASR